MRHLLLAVIVLITSCMNTTNPSIREQAIAEIRTTELQFAKMAKNAGIKQAFVSFAAPDAVLLRNKKIIRGDEQIKAYFENKTLQNVQLSWTVEFADAAESGDMGYTYGPYTFQATDSSGVVIADKGYFHSVWKKQSDGSWKFVWD